MMIYLSFAWRAIRQHPGRALLTTLSIVIGVAAVVAVTFTTRTTRQAFDQLFHTIAGRASLEATGPPGTSIDESLVLRVSNTPGVKAVAPLMQRYSIMYVGKSRVQLVVLGIDLQRDHAIHDYEIVAGQGLDKAHGILLNQSFAQSMGITPGDSVDLLTRRGLVRTHVVGLYASQETAVAGQGAVLLMPLSAAQYLFKAPKKCDTIQFVLQPGANESSVAQALARSLPENVAVRRPALRNSVAEQTSLSTEQGLNMARAFALVVALFIIANTFLINVIQRQRQLGIMRAIGATRRQIAMLVLCEASFLGTIGTIVGCGAGLGLAKYLVVAMGTLYRTSLPPIELQLGPFLVAVAIGLGISVLGAAVPARKAGRISPLDAIRDVRLDDIQGLSPWFVVTGSILVLVSLGLITATIAGWIHPAGIVAEAIVLLVGLVLFLPASLSRLSLIVTAVLAPWLRVEGRLARQQLLRHRARTALTTGVVFIAISTGMGLATSVMDNVQDVKNWYRKAIVADFFVRAMSPEMATGLAADLPDQLDPEIRNVPGIVSIEAVRLMRAEAAGQSVVVVARDFSDKHELNLDIEHGALDAVRDQLRQGDTVIGSVLAQQAKLNFGDTISVDLGNRQQSFSIAAIANDYQAGGLTMYVDRNVAQRLLGVEGVDGYIINANHARLDEVRSDLQGLCTKYGLLLQSYSDIQQTIDVMMSGVVAGLWGLVVLGFVVAAFGIANTLAMTVLEQTREVALLRIVAMTRWQVRKSILAQALIMGLLALVPGIAAGVGVAYLIHWATLPVIGHPVPFGFHPWLLASGFVAGLLIIVAAAWVPAERAARIALPVALSQI
jgi:putative ABC transport system permease protein